MLLAAVSSVLGVVTVDKTVHLWAYVAVALSISLATARHFFDATLFRVTAFVVLVACFSLTEMAIAAPILLGLLRCVAGPARRWELWLAFALPIVRVDLCCVPLVLAIGLLVDDRRRGGLLLLSTVAGVGVQLAIMKLAFGHFVSVAAWLKASASIGTLPDNLRFNLGQSVFQGALLLAHVIFAVLALRFDRGRRTWLLVFASLSFVVMHTALSLLRGWYFVPSALAILFTLERAMRTDRRAGKVVRAARASVALVALAFTVRMIRAEIVYRGDQQVSATFLSELRARVPAGTRIFTFDNPGFLGFFSGLDVVDADGLVNDYEYARRLQESRLAGYLDEERICHVVVAEADDDPVLDRAGLVVRHDEVTSLFAIRRRERSQADFALYRLTAARCAD